MEKRLIARQVLGCVLFQFRYSTGLDKLLMLVGTLCALAHGACLPILLLVFGDMTDLFIDAAQNADNLNQTELLARGCNWTAHGFEWDDIAPPDGDLEDLKYVI